MGFLEAGAPLSWEASARYRDVVKRRGIRQFLQLYKQFSADIFPKSTLSWGDEVEYCLLNLDVQNKVARLYLGAEGVLGELKTREDLVASERVSHRIGATCADSLVKQTGHDTAATALQVTAASNVQAPAPAALRGATWGTDAAAVHSEAASTATGDSKEAAGFADTATAAWRPPWQMSNWHPEYGAHMIEAIPGKVYPLQVDSVLDLLPSMQVRRKKVQAVLPPGCYVASVGSFPTMGAPERPVRPCSCSVCVSLTCCCLQGAPRIDTSWKEGAISGSATGEPAAYNDSRFISLHEAVIPNHPVTAQLRPGMDVSGALTVNAAPDTAAGAWLRGGANVADEIACRGGIVAGANVHLALPVAKGRRATTAASSLPAAYPLSLPKADEGRTKADASVFLTNFGQQSHTFSDRELFQAAENFASSKQARLQRGVIAEAEGEGALLTTQRGEQLFVAGKAAVEGEKKRAERDELTTEDCGAAADVAGQAAKDGPSTQARNTRLTGGIRRITPTGVAEEMCSFPCLARVRVKAHTGDFASPAAVPDPIKSRSRSLFVGDALINPHPRFGTLTANIRERRGKKVEILIPLFVDQNTAFNYKVKNLVVESEPHISVAAPAGCDCASRSRRAADKVVAVNGVSAGGKGGAGTACAARAAGGKTGAAGRPAAPGLQGQGAGERAAEAEASRSTIPDCAKKAPRESEGINKGNISSSIEDTYSKEEYYRKLMLEGKILHDGKSIYMDAMGFGMGMHCVQATFGCPSMRDARYLYDQLAVLAPLWLSLSAATPFMRGLLAGVDSRWDVISACVDCRTDAERSRLPKSRYGTVSLYISDEAPLTDHLSFYNDVPAPVNEAAFAALMQNGVDEILARHMAFLFVRDPLVIFKDKLLAQKPIRTKKSAPTRGKPRAAIDTVSGTTAFAAPTYTAMDFTSSGPTLPSVVTTAAVATPAKSPDTVNGGKAFSVLSHAHPLRTTASKIASSGYRSACSVRLPPLHQQRELTEQEERAARVLHTEDAGEDDSAVVAEAAAAWGIDDGTLYTTTQDFENIQSTNWNSVRFKPPAAFKPWSVSGTSSGPSDAYDSGRSFIFKKSSKSNSMKTEDGQRSNCMGWSYIDGSRTREYQREDTQNPGSASGSEEAGEERARELNMLEKIRTRKRNGDNSVSAVFPPPSLVIADVSTVGSSGRNSGLVAVPTAGRGGDNTPAALGAGGPWRDHSCVQKLKEDTKGENESAVASYQRKLPLSPVEDAPSSLSSLYRSSHTSVPPPPASSSATAAGGECCAVPWRVEFRTPDVQLTDFENVACLSLVSLLVQVILEERLDLYLPMSLNDVNTRRAVECNSILRQKFWFRKDVRHGTADRSFEEFTLHQIFFGGSATRNSDASLLEENRDPSSSTSVPFPARPPFLPTAVSGSTFCSSCGSTPAPSTASSFTSSNAAHHRTRQCPPCSPVSSSCTPNVAVPSAQVPPLLSQEEPPGVPLRGWPPLLHFKNVDDGDEYSLYAPTPSAAALPHLDSPLSTTVVSPCDASPQTAASASAAFHVYSVPFPAGPDDVSGVTHTTATEASFSVTSSFPRALVPSPEIRSVSPFVGLVPLCLRYIEKEVVAGHCSLEAAAQYLEYFDFLRHRTEGLVPTDASFLRACLAVHPAYNQDSVVSARACFDLCQLAVKVGHGEFQVPELFGPFAGRAGMRVSADCCEFDNGVPVVTSSFLSQFVSEALKEMLRGYVNEAPNRSWQEEKQHLFACTRGGATDVTDGAGAGSHQTLYARQETRAGTAEATTETQKVAQIGDSVACSGGQEGMEDQPGPTRAAASTIDVEMLKDQDAAGDALYNLSPRRGSAVTGDGARLHSDAATMRRRKAVTLADAKNSAGKGPASDCLRRRAPATRSKASSKTLDKDSNMQDFPAEPEAGNDDLCGGIGAAGQMLQNTAANCPVPSTPVACTSFSLTGVQDGKVLHVDETENSNAYIAKSANSAFEAENRRKGIVKGEKALSKDRIQKKIEESGDPFATNVSGSTAAQRGGVITEEKVQYPLQLDIGPYNFLPVNRRDNIPSLTTTESAATSRTAGGEDVSRHGSGTAAVPRGTYRATQSQEGLKCTLSCKYAAPAEPRALPFLALVTSSGSGEAGCTGSRMLLREEIADRRISFALSGKAAASLCNADTVSMLRSYMSDPKCRSSAEAGSCAPAAPSAGNTGRERSCKVCNGWPECASVGVTNEEATGLWLFLTSGLYCGWRCDDSGSTSCPSTDDDRESADEVCSIPRVLFSSGEVMAYSKAVLDASA